MPAAKMIHVGWTPWDKKRRAPHQHEGRPGWSGKANRRGIRVYKNLERAEANSPVGVAMEVFVKVRIT